MATKTFTNNGLGRIYYAPADTTVATTVSGIITAVTASSSQFTELGTIQKDGLTVTPRSVDAEEKDWNGNIVVQDVHTEWKFKAIDFLSDDAMKLVFGSANVSASGSDGKVDFDGGVANAYVLVAVMKDGDKAVCAVLRNGKCTNVSDYKFAKGEYTAHDVTIKGEKPSDNGACSFIVYTRDLDADSIEE